MMLYDIGTAIKKAMPINFIYSKDNIFTIPVDEAPSAFLIPISFDRCSAVNVAKPSKPKHATIIAKAVNINMILLT